ncbi:MAG: NAD(P)H-hydrate dehydratase [Lentisphaeria bacterium]
MKAVTAAVMRELDAAAMAAGHSAEELMERAGVGAARELVEWCGRRLAPAHRRRWAVLAGKGNNGGDAYVVAGWLAEHTGLPVTVYAAVHPGALTGAAREHAGRLPPAVPVLVVDGGLPAAALEPGGVVVDGLLGTGLAGPVREPFATLIRQINAAGLPVAALDTPSGLDADRGEPLGVAVVADLTLAMGLPKAGCFSASGLRHTGALRVVEIGLPAAAVAAAPAELEVVTAADIAPLLGRRPRDGHKHLFGQVVVAGGCTAYGGAPLLAGAAALRAGAGLVTVAVPAAVRPWMHPRFQALMLRALPDAGSGSLAAGSELDELLAAAQAVVFGPGCGRAPETAAALAAALRTPHPVVVDADGLRLLAAHPGLLPRPAATVLTPHPGEMRALLHGFGLAGVADSARGAQAAALARQCGAVVVLKGAATVIATPDGGVRVNASGSSALATAGTGDVLAGLVGGLLAQGLEAGAAAAAAVFLHGLAAEEAPAERALVADELIDLLPAALQRLSPFA